MRRFHSYGVISQGFINRKPYTLKQAFEIVEVQQLLMIQTTWCMISLHDVDINFDHPALTSANAAAAVPIRSQSGFGVS